MRFRLILGALALFPFVGHAQMILEQATASQAVIIGPFVDSTDGVTPETGLTIDAADVRISANGGNVAGKNSGGCTHDEGGYYTCTFDATDTATVGRLQVFVNESGAVPVYHHFQVVEEAVHAALWDASAVGPLLANSNGSGLTEAGGDGDHLTESGGTGDQLSAVPWNTAWDEEQGLVAAGTAQSATGTTLVMASSEGFADDTAIGMTVMACGSTQGYCQSRAVTDNTGSSDTLTVDTWTVTPSGTITYYLFGTAPGGSGSAPTAAQIRAEMDSNSTQLAAIVADTNELQTDDVPGLIATAQADLDAITGSDGVTLATTQGNYAPATAAALATVDSNVDAILVDTGTTLQAEVDGIQADTENIQTRIPASLNNGAMPADVQRVNDVEIVGDGSGTPFNVP